MHKLGDDRCSSAQLTYGARYSKHAQSLPTGSSPTDKLTQNFQEGESSFIAFSPVVRVLTWVLLCAKMAQAPNAKRGFAAENPKQREAPLFYLELRCLTPREGWGLADIRWLGISHWLA